MSRSFNPAVFALMLLALGAVACGDNESVPVERQSYTGPTPEPLTCVPNLDGKIETSEVAAAIGIPISYLVSPAGAERVVDVVGISGKDGLVWDFATDFQDDQTAKIVPTEITGKWYAASFPPDAFVTPFDAGGSVENIVRQNEQALQLLGVASRDENPPEGKTLLVYDAPVDVLRFPIAPGVSFVSTGTTKNATLRGLPYAGKDIYEVKVDATGAVSLPALAFTQAHRVRTRVTVEPSVGVSTSRRQVSYFFECFAEVVRVTSRADEASEDFTIAAELRRIGFQ